MDLIIKNGKIFDGTGNPWFKSDIGVDDGRIVNLGCLDGSHADRVIDASRLVVCPGFIDIHSHSDFFLITNPTMDAKVYQGVTTELNGNCGISAAPLIGPRWSLLSMLMEQAELKPSWSSMNQYLDILEEKGHATNTAHLIGYGNIRVAVMGLESREPNERELGLMKSLVAQGMENGLFGLSTGLFYAPNSFATTDELIKLCRVVADHGGLHVTHVRSESTFLIEAIEEAIKISEESGVATQCVHHKAFGKSHWHKIPYTLNLINEARARGVDVTLDVYPYIRDQGSFNGWLPLWVHDGGPEVLVDRLEDLETRERVKKEIENLIDDPRSLLSTSIITNLANKPDYSGRLLSELAELRDMDIIDFALDLIIEEGGGEVGITSQFGSEENVKRILKNPASMVGSDGAGASVDVEGWIHPRNFGTYPRLIGKYVRDENVLTLQDAIRKCTSFPAQRLGLKERGLIREGMWADITIFDYDRIHDKYSVIKPAQYPEGVEYVIINGRIVIDNGRHTGALPGRVLRRNNLKERQI